MLTTEPVRLAGYWYNSVVVDVCSLQPLKVNVPIELAENIQSTLTHGDREDPLRGIFFSARNYIQTEISESLTDFRSKRSLGESALCV